MEWSEVATLVLAALGIFLTVKWQQAKRLLKECSDAVVCLSSAIEDNSLTKEELRDLLREFGDVIDAAYDVWFGKK